MVKAFKEMGDHLVAATGEKADAENAGPAKYNSKAYLAGWEGIFGNKTVGAA